MNKYVLVLTAVIVSLLVAFTLTHYLMGSAPLLPNRSHGLIRHVNSLTNGGQLSPSMLNKAFTQLSIYSRIGYPIISYGEGLGEGRFQGYYIINFSNYGEAVDIGLIRVPVINLQRAYELAVKYLSKVFGGSYDLVDAYFSGGRVVNGSLINPPRWELLIARTYCGFRVWGSDYLVVVNALNPSVIKVYNGSYKFIPSKVSCSYFRVRHPQVISNNSIIKYVRQLVINSNLSTVVKDVIMHGHIAYLPDLRIVKVCGSSGNLLTMKAIDKEFMNKWLLAWVITFYKLPYQVSLLIDASSGKIINYVKGPLYPSMPYYYFKLYLKGPLDRVTMPVSIKLANGSVIKANLTLKALIVRSGGSGSLVITGRWVVSNLKLKYFRNFRSNVTICFDRQLNYVGNIRLIPSAKCLHVFGGINSTVNVRMRYVISDSVGRGIHVVLVKFNLMINGYRVTQVVAIPFLVT